MPAAPDDFARELADIAQRYGPDGLNDRKRVTALLADRLPDAARDVRLVGVAIDNGAVVALRATHPDGVGVEIDRLAARIENHIGTPKQLTLPMLRALAHGLGRGALPSAYASATPEVSTVVAPSIVTVAQPAAVAPAPPVARPTLGLVALVVYWFVAQLYWLWAGGRYVSEIPGVILSDPDLIDFVVVVVPSVIVALGLLAAAILLWRHRSFRVVATAWLVLAALASVYAVIYWMIEGYFPSRDAEIGGPVSIAAAAFFVPYVWRSPAVRRMVVR